MALNSSAASYGTSICLVLALDLLPQELDAFLLHLVIGAAIGLEGGRPILEEFLLPAVEHRRLQSQLVTELGNRLLFQQMPSQDDDLLFSRLMLPWFLHAFSPLS